jgi:uncharacterized integral membrane protein
MMRRLVQIFILLPVAALLIAFSVANRHLVSISLDPFGGETLSLSLPLFVLVFVVLLVGLVMGGLAAWLRQGKWRRQARQEHREAERWRGRVEEAAKRAHAQTGTIVATREP